MDIKVKTNQPPERRRNLLYPGDSRCRGRGWSWPDLTRPRWGPSCARPGGPGPARCCTSWLCSAPGTSPAPALGGRNILCNINIWLNPRVHDSLSSYLLSRPEPTSQTRCEAPLCLSWWPSLFFFPKSDRIDIGFEKQCSAVRSTLCESGLGRKLKGFGGIGIYYCHFRGVLSRHY